MATRGLTNDQLSRMGVPPGEPMKLAGVGIQAALAAGQGIEEIRTAPKEGRIMADHAASSTPIPPAPATDRVIRVFVSSTFRDMQAERDELVKFIFPQLRKLCESRGVTWGEVDLRWGVTDEEKAEGKVLPICLEEIRRCRPWFLGLLGERYGWIPDHIPQEILEREPWLSALRDPAYLLTLPPGERPAFREEPAPVEIEKYGPEEAARRAAERRGSALSP